MTTRQRDSAPNANRDLLIGLARAFGAAVIFALPLLMTMEMWWLGFYMDRVRLALFMLLMVPVLIALDRFSGFKEASGWRGDAVDGMIAYGVGIVTSALILAVLGVLEPRMPLREIVGMVALQAIPASFGAVLASSQLAGRKPEGAQEAERHSGYGAELLFMLAGAIFLAFNVAPTEEIILIAYRLTPWHALAVAVLSLGLMHAFVYAVEFHGTHTRGEHESALAVFFRFTVVGYAISLAVSAYVLWTFGRFEGDPLALVAMETLVLGFPASVGAAAARLIL